MLRALRLCSIVVLVSCSGVNSPESFSIPELSDRVPFEAVGSSFELDASLKVRLDRDGAHVSSTSGSLSLALSSWGRGDDLESVGSVAPTVGACALGQSETATCVRQIERRLEGITE